MSIRFDDKVAIVTGAGGGLGREYALELARRGARVVVNDLGGARDGTGHSDAALKVVAEIEAAGGIAMSNGGSVTDERQMADMVARAADAWGGVHILINNAGILRDKSFAKATMEDWRAVVEVHLVNSASGVLIIRALQLLSEPGMFDVVWVPLGPSTSTQMWLLNKASVTLIRIGKATPPTKWGKGVPNHQIRLAPSSRCSTGDRPCLNHQILTAV